MGHQDLGFIFVIHFFVLNKTNILRHDKDGVNHKLFLITPTYIKCNKSLYYNMFIKTVSFNVVIVMTLNKFETNIF